MAETRESSNQAVACRLCLSDKFETLKPIFCNELGPNSIPQKIQELLLIQVQKEDQISTLICNECIIRLDTWQSYKKQCHKNQDKLLNIFSNKNIIEDHEMPPALEAHSFIKTELDDGDPDKTGEVDILHNSTMSSIKVEIGEINNEEKEFCEMPPPLTPHAFDPNEYTDKSEIPNLKIIGVAEDRKCMDCNKIFCSTYSLNRHKKDIHKKRIPKGKKYRKSNSKNHYLSRSKITLYAANENNDFPNSSVVPQNHTDTSGTSDDRDASGSNIDDSQNVDNESEHLTLSQAKIQFAAGLKLVRKDVIDNILSKVELSYMEKCRAMVSMFSTHKCACHDVQYNSLRNLLSHLKEVKTWFPLFTCYSCMISFNDRSSFSIHYSKCSRASLETLSKLSNLDKRSEKKIRLYQNYKCSLCNFIFCFYDDFCAHVVQEHIVGKAPFICCCQMQFETVESYKTHCLNSCVLLYYCDVCYATTSTINDFLKHCQEYHDNSEGFQLLQKSSDASRKSSQNRESVDIANMVYGKRDRRKSVRASAINESLEGEPCISTAYVRKLLNLDTPQAIADWYKPIRASCPHCRKSYSSTRNMVRHYKSHMEKNEVPVKLPEYSGSPAKSHLSVKLYRDSKTNSYTVNPGSNTKTSKNKKVIGEVMVLCEICDIMFTDNDDLNHHKASCHELIDPGSSFDELQTDVTDTSIPILTSALESDDLEGKPKFAPNSLLETRPTCESCNKFYATKKSLREHMRIKHGKLRKSEYPKKCKYCEKVFSTGSSYYSHTEKHERLSLNDFKQNNIEESEQDEIDVEHEESYFTCSSCFKVFDAKYKLKEHMKSHGVTKSSPKRARKVLCDLCHISVEDKDALLQHKIEEHKNESRDAPKAERDRTSFEYTCKICNRPYHSRRGYSRHMKTHESFKNKSSLIYSKCKYCKVIYTSLDDLKKHMKSDHSEVANSKNLKFKNREPEKLYKCPFCPKFFKTFTAMSSHSGWHKRTGESTLMETPVANTPQATATAKLIKHTKILTKVAAKRKSETIDHQCMVCLSSFLNNTALQIHMLQKHQNVDAKMLVPRCSTCNEDFDTQSAYDIHKRYHYLLERQNEFPTIRNIQSLEPNKTHVCGFCNLKFDRTETLNAHIKVYHDFKCKFCSRVFAKQNSLSAHLKVHDKQKKSLEQSELNSAKCYFCSICKASFNYANDLREHTIKEHPF